jgi:hypothetical protein
MTPSVLAAGEVYFQRPNVSLSPNSDGSLFKALWPVGGVIDVAWTNTWRGVR